MHDEAVILYSMVYVMKNIFLTILYIFIFIIVSLLISQLPAFIKGEELFQDMEEVVICLFAGIAAGLIVGFFSTNEKDQTED